MTVIEAPSWDFKIWHLQNGNDKLNCKASSSLPGADWLGHRIGLNKWWQIFLPHREDSTHSIFGIYRMLFKLRFAAALLCFLCTYVADFFNHIREHSTHSFLYICRLIKSLTNSLLLLYSLLSTWDFNHSSFGSVIVIFCLAIIIIVWCKKISYLHHLQIW